MRWSPTWWADFLDLASSDAGTQPDTGPDISEPICPPAPLLTVVAADSGPVLPKGTEPLTVIAALDLLHDDIARYGEPA